MGFETILTDITARLRQGTYPNEQAISQGIVLPVLQQLGWDIFDTTLVWPEFQTGEGRADFALCHPSSRPAEFIEVKAPGKAEEGVRQALEYAFHTGVPFIVLTDGRTWSFYLPAEQGSYEDRRVYKLDLLERPSAEAAEILHRYLTYERVVSGEALEAARKEYRSRNRRTQARAAIPEAWYGLIEKTNKDLVNMLASAVESKAGVRPDDEDVAKFLTSLARLDIVETTHGRTAPQTVQAPTGEQRRHFANVRMTSRVDGGMLLVRFQGGSSRQWPLPPKSDVDAVRRIRDEAVQFAKQNGATIGQINAVKKALTDARYYVSR